MTASWWKASSLVLGAVALTALFAGCENARLPVRELEGWKIVVAEDATPSEAYAAEEFQSLFEEATGVHLPIVHQSTSPSRNVFIGPSAEMRKSNVGFDTSGFGEEELEIRLKPDNLAIAGGKPRGTLYGVYEFFERFLGARFLTADHTYFPPDVADSMLVCRTWRYRPVFLYRNVYFGEVRRNPKFATRLRVNTVTDSAKYGGRTSQQLINHSFYRLVPVSVYGKTHPEYYALVNGQRKLDMWGGGPQLDVSNPEVVDVVTHAILEEIQQHPEWRNYSVSQNDNDQYCHCDSCEAINRREGTPMGAHLRFVNEVAGRVAQKYPDKWIGTLAYWYTRKPAKHIKPAPNVQIQLADIECCRLHPIDDPTCPRNAPFREELESWSRITNELYIWTYATDFRYYDLPIPNLKSIGPNIRFYAAHHVRGVFEQGNGNTLGGEMSDLRNYVIARCLWDPTLDSWKLAKEFCDLHYGKAAPVIWGYLNFEHDWVEKHGDHPTCFASPRMLGLNREFALNALGYFKRAVAAAENDTIRRRVEKISITAYRSMLEAGGEFVYQNGRLKRTYPPGYEDIPQQYIELAHRIGLTAADERTPFPEFEKKLQEEMVPGIPALKIENATWKILALPGKNGKVVVMEHKPDGRQLLQMLQNNFEYGALDEVPASVVDLSKVGFAFSGHVAGNRISMRLRLQDGSSIVREIWLSEEEPGTVFCKTTIVHRGSKPGTYQFVVHPEFWTGTSSADWNVLSAYVYLNGRWQRYNDSLRAASGPRSHLLVDAAGGGRHAYFNHKAGFGVLETYDPAKIERLRTWWIPDEQLINLEILTKRVTLRRGQSFSYTYQFRYLTGWPPQQKS